LKNSQNPRLYTPLSFGTMAQDPRYSSAAPLIDHNEQVQGNSPGDTSLSGKSISSNCLCPHCFSPRLIISFRPKASPKAGLL